MQYEGAYSNGESKKVSVPAYIQEQQVLLYVNDAKAAQNTIKGTCEIGSTWVVSACQKNSVTNMVPKGTDLAISPYSPANVTSTSTIYLEWAPIIFPEFPNISTYGSLSYILKIDGVDYSKGPVQSFIGTPAILGLTAGTHTLQARVCNQVGCAPWSISVTVNVNTPPPAVEAPAAVPGYNAMSCVSPLLKGVSSGGIGCYGMWDSGNSFGGDVSMCGDYSGLTGCEIKTTACSSGSAIATKVVSPSSLADSQIQVYSTNLKTSVAAVKDNVLKLWEYTCTPVVVSAGHTTSQSLVLGATTMCVNLPRNLHRGDESNDTMNLQKFLYAHDYLTETPSGFYGDMTIKAVKEFQLNKGISATGMVYGVTRAAIANVSCGGI